VPHSLNLNKEKRGLLVVSQAAPSQSFPRQERNPPHIGIPAGRLYGGVQLLSFVCSTGGKGSKPRLWNIQNLGPCTSVVGENFCGLTHYWCTVSSPSTVPVLYRRAPFHHIAFPATLFSSLARGSRIALRKPSVSEMITVEDARVDSLPVWEGTLLSPKEDGVLTGPSGGGVCS